MHTGPGDLEARPASLSRSSQPHPWQSEAACGRDNCAIFSQQDQFAVISLKEREGGSPVSRIPLRSLPPPLRVCPPLQQLLSAPVAGRSGHEKLGGDVTCGEAPGWVADCPARFQREVWHLTLRVSTLAI